nr:hypothetical protein Iba_chr06aCG7030 [Ipomoea batatas]
MDGRNFLLSKMIDAVFLKAICYLIQEIQSKHMQANLTPTKTKATSFLVDCA